MTPGSSSSTSRRWAWTSPPRAPSASWSSSGGGARPAPGPMSDGAGGGGRERQSVVVNLVLDDDAALGGVVGALGGLGARIVALQKSEPSLEDVFVELVGPGFDDGRGPAAAPPRADAAWDRRRVFLANLRSVGGRAFPRVHGLFREPSWVLFEILLPFLTTSAFVFVYRALQAPPQYVGFVVLGGAMTAFWLHVIWIVGPKL